VFESFDAEFQAVAGLLGAAEGDAGVHGAVFVDPDGAGFDAGGDVAGCGEVGGPDGGAEPDLERVSVLDGLVDGGVADDGQAGSIGFIALTIAAAVAIIMVPLTGALSDRWGRRPMVIAGTIFSALFAFPFFWLLEVGSDFSIVLAMIGGIGLGVPLMLGAQGALFSELFSARIRFTGFSVSREIGSILFAGLTSIVAAVLATANAGSSWPVSAYVLAACALTLITGLVIKENRPDTRAPETCLDGHEPVLNRPTV
jgi:MFS family permease